jgi:putative salt-induced outer membrane protein YdiY
MLYQKAIKQKLAVRFAAAAAALVLGGLMFASQARADEVVLKNGDTIHGTVGEITGGVMKFKSPNLGDLSIKLADIKTYKTDAPATVRLKQGGPVVVGPITEGSATRITTAGGQTISTAQVKVVNPPPAAWTGSVIASGIINRGNTNNETGGIAGSATLRRQTSTYDDRFAFGGDYNYGNTGRGDTKDTTVDNGDLRGEYDRYFTDQWYGLAVVGLNHDRIAHLNYRVTPGLGVGYQPFEGPDFNLRGEAGISYLYEDFQPGGIDSKAALRLAYHVDKKLNDRVSVFNDVEWLPAFENPADYVLTADAGIHADITKQFFSEFKVVYRRNDNPPAGTQKDDLEFLAGLGWKF